MAVTRKEQLEETLKLTDEENAWFDSPSSLPLLVSDYFFSLIDPNDPLDPIRKQVVPNVKECEHTATLDPLAEEAHSVSPRLIHRYKERAALLVTDRCFSFCRHCFRRRFTGREEGTISKEELLKAAEYLKRHEEIKEILLTGGDLFTLSDGQLDFLFSTLKEARSDMIIRLCTRAVATYPERFTDSLFNIINKYKSGAPFLLLTQFNHPRELTDKAIAAVSRFVDSGIPAYNQSVLLKGVNDNVEVLEELCHKLLYNRIKPYYLFQCDLVDGTKHLRVRLEDGLEIETELRKRLSGLEMPAYTLDLPEGGGKVILTKQALKGIKEGVAQFTTPDGETRYYPAD